MSKVGKSFQERVPEIRDKLGSYIGTDAEGKKVTLSGLVGLVSAAGMRGAKQWLTEPGDRVKYPGTTKMFNLTNGMF